MSGAVEAPGERRGAGGGVRFVERSLPFGDSLAIGNPGLDRDVAQRTAGGAVGKCVANVDERSVAPEGRTRRDRPAPLARDARQENVGRPHDPARDAVCPRDGDGA